MGFAPGVALGAAFLVAQSAIPAVFTQDPGVISAVTHIVPLLALAMVRRRCHFGAFCSHHHSPLRSGCRQPSQFLWPRPPQLACHHTPSVWSLNPYLFCVWLIVQPLIPIATVLEGALLGAVDTSYIAKRTGLGIAVALAVIYGAQWPVLRCSRH